MEDGEEWLLRPVGRQMCRYESLKDGTLSLFDIAQMNEYLDMQAENEYRISQSRRAQGG
jgi:hypothetical protein